MTIKKKPVIITALALCGIVLATWAILHYKAKYEMEEQYKNSLAERFDKTMKYAFPLISNYAIAIKERADSIEMVAQKAKEDKASGFNYSFGKVWEQYLRTQGGRKDLALLEEYEYFKLSPVFALLKDAGDKKKKEAEAIQKITQAGMMLKEPYLLEYDPLMETIKTVRQHVSESLEVIEPYRSDNKDVHAWSNLLNNK